MCRSFFCLIVDAKEGTYTYNSDGSVTGSGGGIATNTSKRDDNGNEIYQRESGGYYVIDDKGIQRTTASLNVRPVANNTGYNRPYLRQQTIQNIEANYTRLDNGNYINNVSREVIEGPIDIGHTYGWEHTPKELLN